MEIPKVATSAPTSSAADSTAGAGRGATTAAATPPLPDRADIRPLDIAGALQILLTEVRAALDLPLEAIDTQSPAHTARELLQSFLQSLPEDPDPPPVWLAAVGRVERMLQSGMDRAVEVLAAWKDVPAASLAAVQESRTLVLGALSEDAPMPLWLGPEWIGLALLHRRYRRRRRTARRHLSDPDYTAADWAADRSDDEG